MTFPGLAVCLFLGALPAPAGADGARPNADSLREHVDASGSFTFRAPAHWQVSNPEANVTEVEGDAMIVRFVTHPVDQGFDSLHVSCMQDRLGDPLEADPHVDYEYDFLQAEAGSRRVLDSAFRTRYDSAVRGHKDWRQRNVTLVSPTVSLCVVAFCPSKLWKGKSKSVLDGVVNSVSTR